MAFAAAINVHVQIPLILNDDGRPSLAPENWKWTLFLVFPLDILQRLPFLHKPYKWIKYCTGTALGTTGDFSTASSRFDDSFDYDDTLPTVQSQDLYFHTTDAEKSRIFPVDPSMVKKPGVSTSDATSARRAEFADDVQRRDGNRCIVTGVQSYCEAAHLIGHGKGNAYIRAFTTHRGSHEIVDTIDSVRNGVFVDMRLHKALGTDLAMLKTPNFAMTTRDADPTAPDAEETRVFAHVLCPDRAYVLNPVSNGAAVRLPNVNKRAQWPPDVLFDAVYASAVLENFGQKNAKDSLASVWKAHFNPGGAMNALQRDQQKLQEYCDGQERRTQHQKGERNGRRKHRSAAGDVDDLYEDEDSSDSHWSQAYVEPTMVKLMPPEQRKIAYEGFVRRAKAAKEEAEAVALKEVTDKVRRWQECIQ